MIAHYDNNAAQNKPTEPVTKTRTSVHYTFHVPVRSMHASQIKAAGLTDLNLAKRDIWVG